MSQKKEEDIIDIKVELPTSKSEVMRIYNELSSSAKNDNFFMAIFWASYGYPEEAENYINEYKAEFKVIQEYKDRIKFKQNDK